MQEQDGKKQFNISERLEDLRREHEALRWEGTFRDYFELVAQNPRVAQLSHARINDMVHAAGIERLFYKAWPSPHTLSNARKPKRFQGYARAGWQ